METILEAIVAAIIGLVSKLFGQARVHRQITKQQQANAAIGQQLQQDTNANAQQDAKDNAVVADTSAHADSLRDQQANIAKLTQSANDQLQ